MLTTSNGPNRSGNPSISSTDQVTGNFTDKTPGQHDDPSSPTILQLTWRQRIRHFTWTWFCMTMATGQLANCVAAIPFRFPGQHALGVVIMLFNIVLFLILTVCITLRFRLYPSTFWSSLTHPTESLFVPAFVISLGTILTNIIQHGAGDAGYVWVVRAAHALFWAYVALSLASATGIYLVMWSTQTFTLSRMTPVWIFPAYPLLVVAPLAAALAEVLADGAAAPKALAVIVAGVAMQGIGFMVSLMVYAAFLYRLMTQKLPEENLRPGMFISVGPSAFTVAGLIGLGRTLGAVIPDDFMGVGGIAGPISVVLANWIGVWLWGLAIFFLIVSVGAHWACVGSKKMNFAMTWYSFVFPNAALTTATFAVARAFRNRPLQIFGCILLALITVAWVFVFVMMIRAVYMKEILWPDKQEDKDEGKRLYDRNSTGVTTGYHTDVESTADSGSRHGTTGGGQNHDR